MTRTAAPSDAASLGRRRLFLQGVDGGTDAHSPRRPVDAVDDGALRPRSSLRRVGLAGLGLQRGQSTSVLV